MILGRHVESSIPGCVWRERRYTTREWFCEQYSDKCRYPAELAENWHDELYITFDEHHVKIGLFKE